MSLQQKIETIANLEEVILAGGGAFFKTDSGAPLFDVTPSGLRIRGGLQVDTTLDILGFVTQNGIQLPGGPGTTGDVLQITAPGVLELGPVPAPPGTQRWKHYATNDGPENPQNAYIPLIDEVVNLPYSKNYEYAFSCSWTFDDNERVAFFRVLIDGNEEFLIKKEPSDKGNKDFLSVSYLKNLSSGNHTFRFEAKRGGGNKFFEITKAMLKIEEE